MGIEIIGIMHKVFAGLFFVMLIYFALKLFRKKDPDQQPSAQKVHRNRIYLVCGITMIICLVLIAVNAALPKELHARLKPYHPEFWLESIAVIAFGISWLIKGGAILADRA